jgi:hypothetical protein
MPLSLTLENSTFSPRSVFYALNLRTSSLYFPAEDYFTSFDNPHELCLLRGTQ